MDAYNLIIGGEKVDGAATFDVVNPATEEVLAKCPRADAAQLDAAVAAAKRAFPGWSRTPIEQRRAALLSIADALEAALEDFARTVTAEQGKPLKDARIEVGGAVYFLRMTAALDVQIERVIKDDQTGRVIEHRSPLGVVAAIMPWNFPVMLVAAKLAPALLMGNTVVAKPAPTTPLSCLKFVALMAVHVPPGVVNAIVDNNDLGGRLAGHPDVAKVAFTGSTTTGRKVVESSASTLKRLTLELGGNDAAIVLEGANPKVIAPKILRGALVNAGQVCVAIKRVYAPESIYDELCDELGRLASEVVVGDGMEQGTQVGPVQNKAQYEKLKAYIDEARSKGNIVAARDAPDRPGYFIYPTIVRDIPDDARLVCEEQFGPVLPVLKYSDVADAIARANDSEYGLAGSVWAKDTKSGIEVAKQIDTGTVWVNAHMASDLMVPISGSKQSAVGIKMGVDGAHQFSQRHVIYVPAELPV